MADITYKSILTEAIKGFNNIQNKLSERTTGVTSVGKTDSTVNKTIKPSDMVTAIGKMSTIRKESNGGTSTSNYIVGDFLDVTEDIAGNISIGSVNVDTEKTTLSATASNIVITEKTTSSSGNGIEFSVSGQLTVTGGSVKFGSTALEGYIKTTANGNIGTISGISGATLTGKSYYITQLTIPTGKTLGSYTSASNFSDGIVVAGTGKVYVGFANDATTNSAVFLRNKNGTSYKQVGKNGALVTATPKFDGGAVTATAGFGTPENLTLSDNTSSGIKVIATGGGKRGAVLYNGAVDGWVTKSNDASALSAETDYTTTSTPKYISSITVAENKTLSSVTINADSTNDTDTTAGTITTVTNNGVISSFTGSGSTTISAGVTGSITVNGTSSSAKSTLATLNVGAYGVIGNISLASGATLTKITGPSSGNATISTLTGRNTITNLTGATTIATVKAALTLSDITTNGSVSIEGTQVANANGLIYATSKTISMNTKSFAPGDLQKIDILEADDADGYNGHISAKGDISNSVTEIQTGGSIPTEGYYLAVKNLERTGVTTSITTANTAGWVPANSFGTSNVNDISVSEKTSYIKLDKAEFTVDGNTVKVTKGGYIGATTVSAGEIATATLSNVTVIQDNPSTSGTDERAPYVQIVSNAGYINQTYISAINVLPEKTLTVTANVDSTDATKKSVINIKDAANTTYVLTKIDGKTTSVRNNASNGNLTTVTNSSGILINAATFTPTISQKTSGQYIEVGTTASSKKYPVNADLKTKLDAGTSGWFTSSGDVTKDNALVGYVDQGIITTNSTDTNAATALGMGSKIKISKGYYHNDSYYTSFAPSGNIQLNQYTSTNVAAYATATVKQGGMNVASQRNVLSAKGSNSTEISSLYFEVVPTAINFSKGWIESAPSGTTLNYHIKEGSATTPTNSTALSSSSTSLSGTTLTVQASVTPTVSAGWVSAGTAGTVKIKGTVPTEEKTVTQSGDLTPSANKLLSKVIVPAGTISTGATDFSTSAYTGDDKYTNNTTAVVPANGYLYIGEGWYENTQISLATLIPDDTAKTNAASGQILKDYEAYDTNGNKLIGTIPNQWYYKSTDTSKTTPYFDSGYTKLASDYYTTTNTGYGAITGYSYFNAATRYIKKQVGSAATVNGTASYDSLVGLTLVDGSSATDAEKASGMTFRPIARNVSRRYTVSTAGWITTGTYGATDGSLNGSTYYITDVTVPASKTLNSVTLTSGSSTARTYLTSLTVNGYTTITTLTNSGIITSLNNTSGIIETLTTSGSNGITTLTNGSTITTLNGAGTITTYSGTGTITRMTGSRTISNLGSNAANAAGSLTISYNGGSSSSYKSSAGTITVTNNGNANNNGTINVTTNSSKGTINIGNSSTANAGTINVRGGSSVDKGVTITGNVVTVDGGSNGTGVGTSVTDSNGDLITGTISAAASITTKPKITPSVSISSAATYGFSTTAPTSGSYITVDPNASVATNGVATANPAVTKTGWVTTSLAGTNGTCNITSNEITINGGNNYYAPVSSVTVSQDKPTIKTSSTSATTGKDGTINLLDLSDTDTNPGSGIFFTTGGSATPQAKAITYSNIAGVIAQNSGATGKATTDGSSATLTTNKYYVTAVRIPDGGSINIASSGTNKTGKIVTPNAYTLGTHDVGGLLKTLNVGISDSDPGDINLINIKSGSNIAEINTTGSIGNANTQQPKKGLYGTGSVYTSNFASGTSAAPTSVALSNYTLYGTQYNTASIGTLTVGSYTSIGNLKGGGTITTAASNTLTNYNLNGTITTLTVGSNGGISNLNNSGTIASLYGSGSATIASGKTLTLLNVVGTLSNLNLTGTLSSLYGTGSATIASGKTLTLLNVVGTLSNLNLTGTLSSLYGTGTATIASGKTLTTLNVAGTLSNLNLTGALSSLYGNGTATIASGKTLNNFNLAGTLSNFFGTGTATITSGLALSNLVVAGTLSSISGGGTATITSGKTLSNLNVVGTLSNLDLTGALSSLYGTGSATIASGKNLSNLNISSTGILDSLNVSGAIVNLYGIGAVSINDTLENLSILGNVPGAINNLSVGGKINNLYGTGAVTIGIGSELNTLMNKGSISNLKNRDRITLENKGIVTIKNIYTPHDDYTSDYNSYKNHYGLFNIGQDLVDGNTGPYSGSNNYGHNFNFYKNPGCLNVALDVEENPFDISSYECTLATYGKKYKEIDGIYFTDEEFNSEYPNFVNQHQSYGEYERIDGTLRRPEINLIDMGNVADEAGRTKITLRQFGNGTDDYRWVIKMNKDGDLVFEKEPVVLEYFRYSGRDFYYEDWMNWNDLHMYTKKYPERYGENSDNMLLNIQSQYDTWGAENTNYSGVDLVPILTDEPITPLNSAFNLIKDDIYGALISGSFGVDLSGCTLHFDTNKSTGDIGLYKFLFASDKYVLVHSATTLSLYQINNNNASSPSYTIINNLASGNIAKLPESYTLPSDFGEVVSFDTSGLSTYVSGNVTAITVNNLRNVLKHITK